MLTIASNVRRTTAVFAQSLHDAGIRVKRATRSLSQEGIRDTIHVRGNSKFFADLVCDYELGVFKVRIATKKGVQLWAVITTFAELQALFTVWGLGHLQ